jgi:hypothetical protein
LTYVGPVDPGLGSGWPPFRGFCPQRWVIEGSYILMPESRSRHNNTIGLTGPLGGLNYP